MKEVLSKLRELLARNDISIYNLSRITGINRNSLQKALNGERQLSISHFYKIVNHIPMQNQDREYLIDIFTLSTLGHGRYNNNKIIKEIFQQSSDYFSNNDTASVTTICDDIETTGYSYFKNKYILPTLIGNELKKEHPVIRTYIPMDNKFYTDNISNLVKNSQKHISVSSIFEFIDDKSMDADVTNLKIIKTIFPLLFDNKNNYSFYYSYVHNGINNNYAIALPYHIILSDVVILINRYFTSFVVIRDENPLNAAKEHHDYIQSTYKSFLVKSADPISIIKSICNTYKNCEQCIIEYSPCYSLLVPIEIYENIIYDDYINKNELLNKISLMLNECKKISFRYSIFNEASIFNFAKTGSVPEFPKDVIRRLTPSERKIILQNCLVNAESAHCCIRATNKSKFNFPDNISMAVYNNSDIQVMFINFENTLPDYLFINEPMLARCFFNFTRDIIDTNDTYTKEETIGLIAKAIEMCDNQ